MIDTDVQAPPQALPRRGLRSRRVVVTTVAAAIGLAVAALGAVALSDGGSDSAVGRGESATIDGLTWSIVDTKQRRELPIPEGLTYTARNGVYLIAELKLDNASGRAARAVGEYIALLGADGRRYLPDEDGSTAYHLMLGPHVHDPALYDPTRPDPVFGFFDVPVGTARAASLTFDVPRRALEGTPLLEVTLPDGSRTVFEVGL
jgi:hypothetical protein